MKWGNALLSAVLTVTALSAVTAQAIPTRNEIYRSDRLKVAVFKDSLDPEIFWYIPPIKLLEEQGKVVHYKRVKGDSAQYYFYVVPYMNDDLIELLAGELPGLQTRTQLKPIVARQFGIQVKQFNAVSMGDQITDYQYLNHPQLVKVSLSASDAEEFEFFLNNKPGIQANVLFNYETERMDKYTTIEVSYREVYNALNIGGTGKYKFTKAEISQSIEDYVSKKYYHIKSKGDLPIPEIVNRAIEECFTPSKKTTRDSYRRNDRFRDDPFFIDINFTENPEVAASVEEQLELLAAIDGNWNPEPGEEEKRNPPAGSSGRDTSRGPDRNRDRDRLPWEDDDDDYRPSRRPSGPSGGRDSMELVFTFKKEKANNDKAFFYKHEHYVDSSEMTAIPTYLSLLPSSVSTKVKVTPLGKRDFVVEATNSKTKALSTGIQVKADEQYVITAAFALASRSYYMNYRLNWYRWDPDWASPDEDLYYRVGTGPWNKVNGRAVIKTEGIYKGELQFYLDREKIWKKIPSKYKDSKMLGLVPEIFEYRYTYPQFNVVVTGRKVDLN